MTPIADKIAQDIANHMAANGGQSPKEWQVNHLTYCRLLDEGPAMPRGYHLSAQHDRSNVLICSVPVVDNRE